MNKAEFIKLFFKTFDIDKIKDRENHVYLEGSDSENRIKEFFDTHLLFIMGIRRGLQNETGQDSYPGV